MSRGGRVKSRWVPAALASAALVIVALFASGGTIDTGLLVWSALGMFGLTFGLTTVGMARRVDKAPPSPPAQIVAAEPIRSAPVVVQPIDVRAPKHSAELAH